MFLASLAIAAAVTVTPPGDGWDLVYSDTFDGTSLSADWSTRGTAYTDRATHAKGDPRATTVSDGMAHLRVIPDPDNPGAYLTGHIGTQGAFSFTYGYAEARVKFPKFRGAHGAFWMIAPGSTPEVDVAEYFGQTRPWLGNGSLWTNYYWGNVLNPVGIKLATTTDDFGLDRAWSRYRHRYGVLWEPDGYTFYVDGVLVHHIATVDAEPKFPVLSLLVKDFEFDEFRADRLDSYDMKVFDFNVWQRSATP